MELIGRVIEKNRVTACIGQGGMATVYLAEHQTLGNKVAIKVLNKALVHQDNIRKRFLAEARNMARMNHPHVIKVTDLIEEGELVAFVMEYIEGETLKEYMERKGAMSDDTLRVVLPQMLEAVSYVHSQQLVHRDIKPSNFMIDRQGRVKLMDFGIAKTLDDTSAEYTQTGTGTQMGTPMYMSPEQVKNTKEVTFQSDIYTLGVVLWQMVSGRKPYDQASLSIPEIQVSILRDTLTQTNTHWDALIATATQKNPADRYAQVSDLMAAVQGVLSHRNPAPADNDKTVFEQPKDSAPVRNEQVSEQKPQSSSIQSATDSGKRFFSVSPTFVFTILLIAIIVWVVFESNSDNDPDVAKPPLPDTIVETNRPDTLQILGYQDGVFTIDAQTLLDRIKALKDNRTYNDLGGSNTIIQGKEREAWTLITKGLILFDKSSFATFLRNNKTFIDTAAVNQWATTNNKQKEAQQILGRIFSSPVNTGNGGGNTSSGGNGGRSGSPGSITGGTGSGTSTGSSDSGSAKPPAGSTENPYN